MVWRTPAMPAPAFTYFPTLTLARAAYRRVGFRPTGIVTTSAIGDEIGMELALTPPDSEADDTSAAGMVPT